jgi:hypothetical protein
MIVVPPFKDRTSAGDPPAERRTREAFVIPLRWPRADSLLVRRYCCMPTGVRIICAACGQQALVDPREGTWLLLSMRRGRRRRRQRLRGLVLHWCAALQTEALKPKLLAEAPGTGVNRYLAV